jgi:uncharacterized protein YndB with AHSA1/START domain
MRRPWRWSRRTKASRGGRALVCVRGMKFFGLLVFLIVQAGVFGETPDVSSEITRTAAGETVIHVSFLTMATPDKLWRAVTLPEELGKWAAIEAKVELRIGGAYEYYYFPKRPEGKRGMEGARIISYLPGKMLSHSGVMPETWVIWLIEPAGDQQVMHYYAVGATQDWSDTASARLTGLTEMVEKLAKYIQP